MATVYFSNGVPGVDKDSPDFPVQGLTLATFQQASDGSWVTIQRGPDGEPYFGYKATQLSHDDAEVWRERITRAGQAGDAGYVDSGGTWYPGMVGPGRSVVDADGWKALRARVAKTAKASASARVKDLAPAYALAATMAATANLDPAEVLATFRPELSKETIAALKKAYKG